MCDASITDVASKTGRREICIEDGEGLASLTEFKVLKRYEDQTALIEARPRTGRTNQIRIHLAHLGWPVCGDPTYGVSADARAAQTLRPDDPPLCLHAWQISMRHPLDGKPVTFSATPPVWAEF